MKINKLVYDFLDHLGDRAEISGWKLAEEINSLSGRRTYGRAFA